MNDHIAKPIVPRVLFETLLWRRARAAAGAGEPHTVRDFGFGVAAFDTSSGALPAEVLAEA